MKKYYFKVFFSKIKESEWLNEMGKEGYLLSKISDSKYYFTYSDEHKYYYSIENLGVSTQSDEASEYFKSRENAGVTPVITNGSWVYFSAEDCEIKIDQSIYKNNASVYFWRALYLFFFAFVGAVVSGYQAFAAGFLTRVNHGSDGYIGLLTIDRSANTVWNVLKEWLNAIIEFLNRNYLSIFVERFGASDACIVLGALIPIVIILFVLFALNLNEYIEYVLLQNGKTSSFLKFSKKGKKYAK